LGCPENWLRKISWVVELDALEMLLGGWFGLVSPPPPAKS
jgi:hypothetical protein